MKEKEPRYHIQHYGRWRYVIVDSETNMAIRKPGKEHITDRAYDEDGAVFMVFNKAKDAMDKCKELNK